MNFMGMGPMELGVIFLVAFLVLGPGKSIDMARTTGRVLRELRKSFSDLASAVDLEDRQQPSRPRNSPPPDQAQSSQKQPDDE